MSQESILWNSFHIVYLYPLHHIITHKILKMADSLILVYAVKIDEQVEYASINCKVVKMCIS